MKLTEVKDKLDFEKIMGFCKKNIRYISAGAVAVALVAVIAVTAGKAGSQGEAGDGKQEQQENQPEGAGEEAFAVDAIPEVNALIQNYYTAYAAGDTAALEACATPISELEKNYIALMSQYVTSYENVKCNTVAGLNEGDYAVSVEMDMRFEGVEAVAPGLDFFYVRKNAEGAFYIDNLYSQFNWTNKEQEMDSQITAFIQEFESRKNCIDLTNAVQARFDAAIAADESLRNMVEATLPQAMQEWINGLAAAAGSGEAPQPEAPAENPAPQPETPAENPAPQPETPQPEAPADNQGGGLDYVPDGTDLTASDSYNVREAMREDADKLGVTSAGDRIHVIMSYAEGWTKVEWNGKTGYIRTDLLLGN